MADNVRFVGGDDVIEPFQILGDGALPIDLTGATITGFVAWVGGIIQLTAVSGLQIVAAQPGLEDPHGFVVLTSSQTAMLPYDHNARFRITVHSIDGLVTSTELRYLERVR